MEGDSWEKYAPDSVLAVNRVINVWAQEVHNVSI